MNASRYGLATIQKRQEEGVTTEHEGERPASDRPFIGASGSVASDMFHVHRKSSA